MYGFMCVCICIQVVVIVYIKVFVNVYRCWITHFIGGVISALIGYRRWFSPVVLLRRILLCVIIIHAVKTWDLVIIMMCSVKMIAREHIVVGVVLSYREMSWKWVQIINRKSH